MCPRRGDEFGKNQQPWTQTCPAGSVVVSGARQQELKPRFCWNSDKRQHSVSAVLPSLK